MRSLTPREYSNFTITTAIYPKEREMDYLVSGLCSEAGEVAGKWKKIIRDKAGVIDREDNLKIAHELGDVLWYIDRLAGALGSDLQEIMEMNHAKLSGRKQRDKLGGSGDDR